MRILLIIENIAERQRILRGLDGGLNVLVGKSRNEVFDYVSQFQFDVVISDLVFGNLTASELYKRLSSDGQIPPRFLCLLSDHSLTNAEVTSLRAIQENESVDVMKKPIVDSVLDSYLQNLLESNGECGSSVDCDLIQPLGATPTGTGRLGKPGSSPNNVRDELHRLDSQHKELETTVSMLQRKVAALEKGMPELTNTLDSE